MDAQEIIAGIAPAALYIQCSSRFDIQCSLVGIVMFTFKLYLVHVLALLSLNEINNDRCIYMLLNHYFINST
jgi:hypothetical protein